MPNLIPTTFDITAGLFGEVSSDPLTDAIVLPFDTNLKDITNNRFVLTTHGSTPPVISASSPQFGVGCLSSTATATAGLNYATVQIVPGGVLDILSGAQDFTIDFWVKPSAGTGTLLMDYGNTHNNDGASNFGLNLQFSTDVLVATGIVNSANSVVWPALSSPGFLTIGTWAHIAIVRHNGLVTLYINGINRATQTWVGFTLPGNNNSSFINFGWSEAIQGASRPGFFDEFRVTRLARWTANFTPPTAPTTIYPARAGYADGEIDGVSYGSAVPSPPVVDFDPVPVVSSFTLGPVTAPFFTFAVTIDGEMLADDLYSVSFVDSTGQQQNLLMSDAVFTNPLNTYGTWTWTVPRIFFDRDIVYPITISFEDPNQEFNCHCDIASPYATLATVRRKMLIRLGYPNQLTNPPPGMATLVDQFLRDAQDQIYRQLQRAALWTERFYRWTMVPGQRYYGFRDNEGVCDVSVDPYKITWVGFEDLNRAWYRLDEGIPPEYYTRANINFGWPTRFEVRSCIEIFPAPQAAYTLWVKGDFPPAALVADDDAFTIDDVACFLLALGNAKAHYGQKDAQLVLTQAGNYTKSLVAGAHGTKRYVPRSETENPLTPPRFLPLGNDQA